MNTHTFEWAQIYAARGWHIFPLKAGAKTPAVSAWEKWATLDTPTIEHLWGPDADQSYGIGLACGPSRLVVIDLDVPKDETGRVVEDAADGRANLEQLAEAHGQQIPWDTYTTATASGGTHLYFRAPEGVQLRNTTSKLAPLVDTRAHGGYVVAPPSQLVTGGRYTVLNDVRPLALPAWLADLLRPATPRAGGRPAPPATDRQRAYIEAAIRKQAEHLRAAGPGQRNHTLYASALALGRFVAAGQLSEAELTGQLVQAAGGHITAGAYTLTEALATIASGITAAHQNGVAA